MIFDVIFQDLSWYDVTATGDFASRMTEDLNKMQDGMGEKVMTLTIKYHCNDFDILLVGEGGDAVPFHSDWYWRFCLPLHTGRNTRKSLFYRAALAQNWLLSLVLLTVVPAMAVMGGIIGKIMTAAAKDEMDIYGKVQQISFKVSPIKHP